MDEISRIAAAYYESGSEEDRNLFIRFFRSMDEDGNDLVSFTEFEEFMRYEGHENMCTRQFFNQLDTDTSGGLDFNEMITLYYIIKSGRPICCRCQTFITGTYFTCITCFNHQNFPFSVCLNCYEDGAKLRDKHFHKHGQMQFVDSFVLLEFKRKSTVATKIENQNQQASSSSQTIVPNHNTQIIVLPPRRNRWMASLSLLNAGIQIASTLANCTIM